MISITNEIPDLNTQNAEFIKIKCLFETYKNDNKVLFFEQDNGKAFVSVTDGNMIIYNISADIEELTSFVDVMSPVAIYSDYETLKGIGRIPRERINIMSRKADVKIDTESDTLKSDEIYSLLDVEGLSLPDYPSFAVDYCRRLNLGLADYFALRGKCACITFNCGDLAIINGLASKQKGFGHTALLGALTKNFGRTLFVCCRDKVLPFYEKYGFQLLYFGGYWVKSDEYN